MITNTARNFQTEPVNPKSSNSATYTYMCKPRITRFLTLRPHVVR